MLESVLQRILSAALVCVIAGGCGRGLTVGLTAEPDPAEPGEKVTWNLSVRNDSQCETVEDLTELPDPFPDTVGVFGIIIGFVPDEEGMEAADVCRMFESGMEFCRDEECLFAHLEQGLGPSITDVLRTQAQAVRDGTAAAEVMEAGSCSTVMNDPSGFAAICAFDPLSAGETDTAKFMETAPDTGSGKAAQLALAFALAEGEDCRPGVEIDENLWTLAGCFPPASTRPVPLLSPTTMSAIALLLLCAGVFTLYRRQR